MTKNRAAQLLGARGGKQTASTHGNEYMAKLARKGGRATKKLGADHFRELGKKGAAARWAKKQAKELPTGDA